MKTKSVTKSLTFGGIALLLAGWLIPHLVADAKLASDLIEAVGLLIATIGRMRLGDLHWPWQSSERGSARLGFALVVGGLGFIALAWTFSLGGCASREVVTERPIGVQWWEGPPCRVHITEAGEPLRIVRNPKGSQLKCMVAPPDPLTDPAPAPPTPLRET